LAKATVNKAEIYFASDLIRETYSSDLIGDYQEHNKKTVIQTFKILSEQTDFKVSDQNIKSGLLHVVKNTGLLGRWQQLGENPKVICDTAHNKNGLEIVLKQIQKETFNHLHIVLGVVNDKELGEVLPLFPKNATYYFCKPNIPRGLDASLLQEKAQQFSLIGTTYHSVTEAYEAAQNNSTKEDFIYVGGSTFVVAELPINKEV
jgi:dihydrofolate synthase/folylpolyglutamate synthase